MILKGFQRGGARRLAAHLLNTKDNEHVMDNERRPDKSEFVCDCHTENFTELDRDAVAEERKG